MRYERKYRIEASSYDRVYHEIMSSISAFSEAYPDRQVNSIYYDDINYSAYNDNLLGIGDRQKYRVRWYGKSHSEIDNPILERKIKSNLLGRKEFVEMMGFSLSESAPQISHYISDPITELYPYIIVSYLRTYLQSQDGLIRATIDRALKYTNLIDGRLSDQTSEDPSVVLEIKYDQGREEIANQCMQALPYRMTKNSKYVSAMLQFLH